MRWLVPGLVALLSLSLCLCRCAVFDDGMRRGGQPDVGLGPDGGVDDDREAGYRTDEAGSGGRREDADAPAVCAAVVGGGTGASGCGGQGGRGYVGRPEREPNDDPNVEPLERGVLVCGEVRPGDNDQFEFAVAADECFEIVVELTGEVEAIVIGVDTDVRYTSNQHQSFRASRGGTFELNFVASSRGGSYRVLWR